MLHVMDFPQNILPDPSLIDALRSDHLPAEALKLLAGWLDQVKENGAALKQQADKAYEEAARSSRDTKGLLQLADLILESERGAAERLYPRLEAFKQVLGSPPSCTPARYNNTCRSCMTPRLPG